MSKHGPISPHRDQAYRLLLHYLTLASQGRDMDAGDNYSRHDTRVEVQEIVDHTVVAAKEELAAMQKADLEGLAQLMGAQVLMAARQLAQEHGVRPLSEADVRQIIRQELDARAADVKYANLP